MACLPALLGAGNYAPVAGAAPITVRMTMGEYDTSLLPLIL